MIKQFVKQELVKRGCRGITTGIATSHEGFGSLIVPNLCLEELQLMVGGCLNTQQDILFIIIKICIIEICILYI